MYVITTQGRNGCVLFLTDGGAKKNKWWAKSLDKAKVFESESKAKGRCDSLIYGNPEVLPIQEAKEAINDNEYYFIDNDVHPLSGEALGQD